MRCSRASASHPGSDPCSFCVAAIMLIVGELSAFFLFSQLGFIVALLGIVLGIGGIFPAQGKLHSDHVSCLRDPASLLHQFPTVVAPSAHFIGTRGVFHQTVWGSCLSDGKRHRSWTLTSCRWSTPVAGCDTSIRCSASDSWQPICFKRHFGSARWCFCRPSRSPS